MLFPPNPRHFPSSSDGALALSGGGLVAAPSALPSRSWLGSLALHGLVLIAAVYVTLPKPVTAPVLAPAVIVQFAAMPVPEVVPAPAPVQQVAPPPEPVLPEPPVLAEPVVTEPAVIEPVNEPPPILTRQALAEEAVPPPAKLEPVAKPKPPTKPKPVVAKPARPKPETNHAETKPVEAKPEPAPVPTETAMVRPAAPAPAPVAAPSPALPAAPLEAAAPPISEPPVLHQARFRRPPTPPAYPPRSRALEQEGVSVVRALIDPDGSSREVRLWRSSGYQMLDQAALAAVRGWAFEAARFGGRPVLAWVEIPVRFELR